MRLGSDETDFYTAFMIMGASLTALLLLVLTVWWTSRRKLLVHQKTVLYDLARWSQPEPTAQAPRP